MKIAVMVIVQHCKLNTFNPRRCRPTCFANVPRKLPVTFSSEKLLQYVFIRTIISCVVKNLGNRENPGIVIDSSSLHPFIALRIADSLIRSQHGKTRAPVYTDQQTVLSNQMKAANEKPMWLSHCTLQR